MKLERLLRTSERQFRIEVLIYAFLAAMSSVMLSRTLNRNIILKNEMIILESHIADEWSYYQAKSIRRDLLSLARASGLEAKYVKEVGETAESLETRRDQIYKEARALEAKRTELETRSNQYTSIIQIFATSITFLQIALLLTSMLIISSSRWIHGMAVLTGFGGGCLFIYALATFAGF